MRIGSCNHCGTCCRQPYVGTAMIMGENEDRCKFYTDEQNIAMRGHCLIYGRGDKSIQEVRDRFGKQITEQQVVWFKDNCVDYPTEEDAKVWTSFGGVYPPEGCGFKFKED